MGYELNFERAQAILDGMDGMYWACRRCGGTGLITFHHIMEGPRACSGCHGGARALGVPDIAALLGRCVATRGARKGRLLRSAPGKAFNDADARARYLWRMLRFHAGIDACIPWGFDMEMGGDDGAREALDSIAIAVVAAVTRRKTTAGQDRWHTAFTGDGDGDGLNTFFRGQAFQNARLV